MNEGMVGVVLGVVLGVLLTGVKELWSEWRARSRHAKYLAIRVVCILDQYVEGCVEVVIDDGLSGLDGTLEPQSSPPDLSPFPQDIDWKALPPDLMYKILSFPGDIDAAMRVINFTCSEISGPPYYEECFEERQYQQAVLGLSASELTSELRSKYALPESRTDGWDPIERLAKKKAEIKEERQNRVNVMSRKTRVKNTEKEVEASG